MNILCHVFLLALIAVAKAAEPTISGSAAPELDALFQRTNGWIGADGAYSVPLSKEATVWLFSDTFVGEVRDGKRHPRKMINNSVALQRKGQEPEFFYRTNQNGEPESFIKPKGGQEGYFWLMHGTRNERGLFMLLSQVKTVDAKSAFGFETIGLWLGHVANPDDPPLTWNIRQTKIPFARFDRDRKIGFGSAVLDQGGFTYIYGHSSERIKGPGTNITTQAGTIVVRVPRGQLDDFKSWRFFSNGEWVGKVIKASRIDPAAPSECSVNWIPALNKYVWVYAEGLWGKIVMRTASEPTGPWSAPIALFQAPEMKWSRKVFCYAGKNHPELAGPNELIITYAANSTDFSELMNDARLYWPRFVKVKIGE